MLISTSRKQQDLPYAVKTEAAYSKCFIKFNTCPFFLKIHFTLIIKILKIHHYIQPQTHMQEKWSACESQPTTVFPGTDFCREQITWCKISLLSGGPKGTSDPEGYGW